MPRRTNDGIKKRCGHKRKTWNDCACPWWFNFHHGGREYRYSLTKLAHARGDKAPTAKDDAIKWRDRLRTEIRERTFVDPDAALANFHDRGSLADAAAAVDTRLTFGDVCDEYLKRHVRIPTRRPLGKREMEIHIAVLREAEIPGAGGETVELASKPIDAITRADVEAVRTWRRRQQAAGKGKSLPGNKGGECGTNRILSRLRHLFSWAVVEGYLNETPFKRGSISVIRLATSAENARTRRLEPSVTLPDGSVNEGEEARLLKHATPHLRAVIVAALSTGCRLGELLSLQWSQVRRDEKDQARWIVLEAAKTKTAETRTIPIGPRLRAELDMRRHAADGEDHPPTAYIFGNEAGEQVASIRRAWDTAVLKAHGYEPVWSAPGKLAPESRAALRSINLHFHDLRRQFACTLLESGADLHDVRDFLGHANITTTSRYLQSTPLRLERILTQMEGAAGFAHHSHTEADKATENHAESESAVRPNVVN